LFFKAFQNLGSLSVGNRLVPGHSLSVVKQYGRKETHQRFLYPSLSETDKHKQQEEIEGGHSTEGEGVAPNCSQGKSGSKRQVDEREHEQHAKQQSHRGNCQQAHNLNHYIELGIACLKPDVMFRYLNQLADGFNIFVVREHAFVLCVLWLSGILDVVNEVVHFLSAHLYIMFLADLRLLLQ